jgi:hypothetical protein
MLVRKLRMNHRNNRLADELRDLELEEEEICRLAAIWIDDSLQLRQVRLINKRLLLEQAQDDIWLELFNPTHDSSREYIQAVVVQFAFVSCFSVVLPITPLIVLFNYLISMRLDAYKLRWVVMTKRPHTPFGGVTTRPQGQRIDRQQRAAGADAIFLLRGGGAAAQRPR